MRQIWITRAGAPEVLRVKEAADPAPNAGEVRIRVEASGVNFADIMGRMGVYPDLPPIPVVPGYEVSGRIDAVADQIRSVVVHFHVRHRARNPSTIALEYRKEICQMQVFRN